MATKKTKSATAQAVQAAYAAQRELHKRALPLTPQPRPALPAEGFVRLPQILAVLPFSKSHWWDGIKKGKYPPGIKLGPKLTVWRVEDVRTLIASAGDGTAANDTMVGGR